MNVKKLKLVYVLSFAFAFTSLPSWSLELGDKLTPLTIDSTPVAFHYEPKGEMQLIMVYPLAFSSRKCGKFNERVIRAGFCPKSIVDMQNRAWYAPVKLAEAEMKDWIEKSPNPACTTTADYDGTTSAHWGLDKGPTTILADADGKVVFLEYGILDEMKQLEVLAMLAEDRQRRQTLADQSEPEGLSINAEQSEVLAD